LEATRGGSLRARSRLSQSTHRNANAFMSCVRADLEKAQSQHDRHQNLKHTHTNRAHRAIILRRTSRSSAIASCARSLLALPILRIDNGTKFICHRDVSTLRRPINERHVHHLQLARYLLRQLGCIRAGVRFRARDKERFAVLQTRDDFCKWRSGLAPMPVSWFLPPLRWERSTHQPPQ
jgi:hypothetical protein